MGELGVLSKYLDEVKKHYTVVGKVWLTILFVFRILVLKFAAEKVWGDEQSNFLCDTGQPGCKEVCYDKTFPISHIRFWMMQIIFVSTPSLIYLGHVIHRSNNKAKKLEENDPSSNKNAEKPEESDLNTGSAIPEGALLPSYFLHIVSKILLEVACLAAQYYLYGFGLETMYRCDRWPCLTTVFCYISRPTEKTFFIVFMAIMTCVSLLLNLVEMVYLIKEKKSKVLCYKKPDPQNSDTTPDRHTSAHRHDDLLI